MILLDLIEPISTRRSRDSAYSAYQLRLCLSSCPALEHQSFPLLAAQLAPFGFYRVVRFLKDELGVNDDGLVHWRKHWVEEGLQTVEDMLSDTPPKRQVRGQSRTRSPTTPGSARWEDKKLASMERIGAFQSTRGHSACSIGHMYR